MKLKYKFKKLILPILIFLAVGAIGISVSLNLNLKNHKLDQSIKNSSKTDSVQSRIQKYMNAGIGAIVSNPTKKKLEAASTSLTVNPDTDLTGYAGLDIAKINLKNVFTSDNSIWHQEAKPNTGIIVVNTNFKFSDKSSNTINANAYDYVSLKYVQYNKKTGTVVADSYSSPPPGLFGNNVTTWPNWKADDAKNSLSDFFPSVKIRNKIESTFGFDKNETFNETEWLAKLNESPYTLDLRSLSLTSIAELFNPNLIWGFGIYNLFKPIYESVSKQKIAYEQNDIFYNGLYKILVSDNDLDYFPNPQFKNMPALRYIQANNNQIKAVGDFASYQNGDLKAETSSADKPDSYFLYLKSLWDASSKYKDNPAVTAIKNWLTTSLPTKAITDSSATTRTINNQESFQIAISANDVFLRDDNGDFLKKFPNNRNVNLGAINFASVVLNVSKNIYQIDFGNNQIERILPTLTRFTYVNFSNNKLKYVPPLAIQPLPWNYLASGTFDSSYLNRTEWNKNYTNNNSLDPDSGKRIVPTPGDQTIPVVDHLIAPSLKFNNNQILDWWPNNQKADGAENDGWYTWPNTTTGESKDPPVVNTIASTHAQAPAPYNRSTYSDSFYNAYLHRNFLTTGSYGERYTKSRNSYNSSAANLLGDWVASGYTSGKTPDFYQYYFANSLDSSDLVSQQNFTASLTYNLFSTDTASKQKNFILPGYDTTGKHETSIANFNSNKTNTTDTNHRTDLYYDNLVPYFLGRTLPQNRTTAGNWADKNLKVELLDSSGNNLLSSDWGRLSWQTVFNNLSKGTFNNTDDATTFIKQVIGALPNFNGTYDSGINGSSSNKAEGLTRSLFQNKNEVTLKIEESTLGLNYTYKINVLKNLDYIAQAKHPLTSGDIKVENVADTTSTFSKKNNFASPSQIKAGDLIDELDSWLKTSDYVKLYLVNNPNALTITHYDIKTGTIEVNLKINDINGTPISLSGLDNNNITLKGFQTLDYSFVNDAGNKIAVNDNTELDKLTDHFLPENETEFRTWIAKHFQMNWMGLELADGSKTTGNYHKISELKNPNNYIRNLNFQANSGAVSFTILVPATSANDNVPLLFSKNLNGFLQFKMSIDKSSYHESAKQSFFDYQQNLNLIKKFVKLAPVRTLNSGTTETKTTIDWTGINSSNTDQYIPPYANLKLVINNSSSDANGVLDFSVSLNNKTTNTPITTLSSTLSNLYNYTSQFSLKNDASSNPAGVRYINDSTKSNLTVKNLFETLKSYANNQTSFRTWLEPLIDYSKSDQTYVTSSNSWSASSLNADQKNQLVYGFNSAGTLTASDISDNVSYDSLSNTLKINNLVVKGGYKNGHFYSGTDADTLITSLPNSTYSFFSQTTQAADISSFKKEVELNPSNWKNQKYEGANNYFQSALEHWKDLLPSQWLAKLLSLKNQNQGTIVNTQTYDLNNYDTLFSFLNHVLNTSTSNTLFKTRIDINDLTQIQVNDFAGLITIPANTLLIYNNYSNSNTLTPDTEPKLYDKEIKFLISSGYQAFITDAKVRNALPWKLNDAVNSEFQAVDSSAVKNNLDQLLASAKSFYDGKANSDQEKTAALTAIQVLANHFIANEYYNQPDARIFFSEKFKNFGPEANENQYTEFSNIGYENIDPITGTMTIKVSLKNYISGYNTATGKYILEDKNDQTFTLNNLLRQFGTPVWNGGEAARDSGQTLKSETVNLATTAPELDLINPKTKMPFFSYQTLERAEFLQYTAEDYYQHLITNKANQLEDYIIIGPSGFKFANWAVVNNFGLIQENLKGDELTNFLTKLNGAQIVVKKANIRISTRNNQIYFLNPVVHFPGTYSTVADKKAAMANIFDPAENSLNHVPFDADNNFLASSLPTVTLSGFKKIPTKISLKQTISTINLGNQIFSKNQVLPSQIYNWIQNNFSNKTELYKLFTSLYNLEGTSDLTDPLTIILNPEVVQILSETNGSGDISQWIKFNDGLGTIEFNNLFFVVNSFASSSQPNPTVTALEINRFMSVNNTNNFSATGLKKSSFEILQANPEIQRHISSSINNAIIQLEQNNFKLAHELLLVNEVKTNLLNQESQLQVTGVSSDLQSGQILIHYMVKNTYQQGKKINMSGTFILRNFYSPMQDFLKNGLAPLTIGFLLIVILVFYVNGRYHRKSNTMKFTIKKVKY